MRTGAFGNAKQADTDVQNIIDGLKSSVEEKLGRLASTFTAISYATQVVAGTNYIVKIDTGADTYIHVKLHKPLPHTVRNCLIVRKV